WIGACYPLEGRTIPSDGEAIVRASPELSSDSHLIWRRELKGTSYEIPIERELLRGSTDTTVTVMGYRHWQSKRTDELEFGRMSLLDVTPVNMRLPAKRRAAHAELNSDKVRRGKSSRVWLRESYAYYKDAP
ncbi:hypothetical protein JYT84_00540, partial [bacterium AH-315-M10]|nr:hypothetical protein [bacterium AH-315-M10]